MKFFRKKNKKVLRIFVFTRETVSKATARNIFNIALNNSDMIEPEDYSESFLYYCPKSSPLENWPLGAVAVYIVRFHFRCKDAETARKFILAHHYKEYYQEARTPKLKDEDT